MKFLQVGLGSMGKRRVRNLLHCGISKPQIAGFDVSSERRAEAETASGIVTFSDFQTAIDSFKPEVLIISTPPHLHAEYFLYAAKQQLHFFVEVATTDTGYSELLTLLPKIKTVAAPSCNFRYFAPVLKLKEIIETGEIGKIQYVTHHMGQYLPDWHPWEDYRTFYVSRPESSACREMVPFELSWLQWLLGCQFTSATGMLGNCSELELPIPDTYSALLKTNEKLQASLVVDVTSRFPLRSLRILGSEGILEWDWQREIISVFTTKTKKWQRQTVSNGTKRKEYTATTEDMYNSEIEVFLESIAGKRTYPYSFEEDKHNFELLRQIERGGLK